MFTEANAAVADFWRNRGLGRLVVVICKSLSAILQNAKILKWLRERYFLFAIASRCSFPTIEFFDKV